MNTKIFTFTLVLIAMSHGPALAEPSFQPGDFFMATRSYDHETDSFTEGAPEGEAEACFVVTAKDEKTIDFTLVSGHYKPWWSETVILPGAKDSFVQASGYAENHPEADDLALVYLLHQNVESCPAP